MYFWLCLCISDVREKCMFCRTRMSLLLPFMNSSSWVSCVVKKWKFFLFYSPPSTSWRCWATVLLSVLCGGTSNSTPPCIPYWPTSLSWRSATSVPMCPTCYSTSYPRPRPSPIMAASCSSTSSSLCATELFFLALMAFDRYVAICCPLHYPTIMTRKVHGTLVCAYWVGGFLWLVTPAALISQVPFCGPNIIDHYLCDLGAMLAISCVPVPKTALTCSTFSAVIIFITLFYILVSYTMVLWAVVQVPKGSGRKKAFSTCASHLIVVFLFYGSVTVMYVSLGATSHPGMQKFLTMLYSIATPLLNPLIYSLRNKEMKVALRKVMCRM